METEQTMVRLLAEIKTNCEEMKTSQPKTGANLKEIGGDKEEMLAKMETNQGKLEAKTE
jgi:hypothetical protein